MNQNTLKLLALLNDLQNLHAKVATQEAHGARLEAKMDLNRHLSDAHNKHWDRAKAEEVQQRSVSELTQRREAVRKKQVEISQHLIEMSKRTLVPVTT